VLLYPPKLTIQEELWQTKKKTNAEMRFAPVRPSPAANTAAPHAKAKAVQLNSIAIAVTRSAAGTFNG
jgi:hypothetical protein